MLVALIGGFGTSVWASSATNISGLYYTGLNNSGGLQSGGSLDANWDVTYAFYNNTTYTGTSAYTGSAYTVLGTSITGSGYVQNTSAAQWITAPGAAIDSSGSPVNTGGLYLPGNGTSTALASKRPNTYYQEAIFLYTLAFNITGTGAIGSLVTNAITIGMTIAADDQYSVFVNPTGKGTTLPSSSTASASGLSAWTNTTSFTLQNGTNGTGTSGNARFVIGTNYIVIEVDNTNGVTSPSTASVLNASGLLVYQVGNAVTIDGRVVPETGAWIPIAGAMGLFGFVAWRRSKSSGKPGAV